MVSRAIWKKQHSWVFERLQIWYSLKNSLVHVFSKLHSNCMFCIFFLFQKLPEEKHIYRISEKDLQGSLSLNNNVGVVISRIPFTHCQNVVKIIRVRYEMCAVYLLLVELIHKFVVRFRHATVSLVGTLHRNRRAADSIPASGSIIVFFATAPGYRSNITV